MTPWPARGGSATSRAAADALLILGRAHLGLFAPDGASACLTEAYALATKHELSETLAYTEEGLGLVALEHGELGEAVTRLQSALRRQHAMSDHWRSSSLLVELASCRRRRGEPYEAAQLLGAAEGLLDKIGA